MQTVLLPRSLNPYHSSRSSKNLDPVLRGAPGLKWPQRFFNSKYSSLKHPRVKRKIWVSCGGSHLWPGFSFMPFCQDESNKVRGMGAVQLLFLHINFIVLLKGIVQLPKPKKTLNCKIPPCQEFFLLISGVQNVKGGLSSLDGLSNTGSGPCRGNKESSSASGDAGHCSATKSNGCYSNLYGQAKPHTCSHWGKTLIDFVKPPLSKRLAGLSRAF